MIKRAARVDLTKEEADLAFAQAQTLPGAAVEMIEQSDGLFTVVVVWDDGGASVEAEDLTAFERSRTPAAPGRAGRAGSAAARPVRLGDLSKRFESNGNPGAIGNDSTGGPSYGEYQIATRTGTMREFMRFLRADSPGISAALEGAGGATAAALPAPAFVAAWRAAARDPAFADAQHRFIEASHYAPFARRLDDALTLGVQTRSLALKNVVWSVAVQHGAGNKVFHNALAGQAAATLGDRAVIDAVYDERSQLGKYFSSSKPQVLAGLAARFVAERRLALQMLA